MLKEPEGDKVMGKDERIVELVRYSKLGNAHAFAELYEMIYQDLYKTALYRLGNAADAENAVSDTVLDAYAGIGRLRVEKAFKAWIFRILSNKINRILREYVANRQNQMGTPIEEMSEAVASPDNAMQNAEDKTLIQSAFSVLNYEERQIVTMTVYGEYDSGQIADMMNLNRNTVRSKYSRALAKMKNFLSSGGEMYGQQR